MSPALFVCPCMIAMASILSGIIGWHLARDFWKRGKKRLAFAAVPVALLLGNGQAVLLLYGMLRSSSGFGLSPKDVPPIGLAVPKEASDVNYWSSPHLGTRLVVDFSIPEDAFLAWAQSRGWNPSKFSSAEGDRPVRTQTAKARAEGTREAVTVLNGYYHDTYLPPPQFDDSGWTIIYDLDHGRAYVRLTAF